MKKNKKYLSFVSTTLGRHESGCGFMRSLLFENKKVITSVAALTLCMPLFAHAALFNASLGSNVGRPGASIDIRANANIQNKDSSDHQNNNGNNQNDDHDKANMNANFRASTSDNDSHDNNSGGKSLFSRWFGGLVNWFHFGGNGSTTPMSDLVVRNIAVSQVSTTSVQITWNTNMSTTGEVRYGTDESRAKTDGSAVADTTSSETHTVTLNGLSADTKYFFVVTSKNSDGDTKTSGVSTFRTASDSSADTTAPKILFSTVISVGSNSARLIWITNELSDSKVWVSTSDDVSTNGDANASLGARSYIHDVEVNDLASDTKYFYKLGGSDASSNLALSATDSFTTK